MDSVHVCPSLEVFEFTYFQITYFDVRFLRLVIVKIVRTLSKASILSAC